jgi:AraC-like DNA-binding protein/ligand-binding sensor protein
MERMQFIFKKEVKKLFDCFGELLGVRLSLSSFEKSTPSSLKEVMVSGQHDRTPGHYELCEYCSLLRHELELDNRCMMLDKKKTAEAIKKQRMISYQCHGGMTEAVVPISIADETVGVVMMGQFRTASKHLPPAIERLWKKRFGNQKLKRAYLKAPCYDTAKTEKIFELLSMLIKSILAERLIYREEATLVKPLITYLDEHPDETLTISQAANLIYRSPSTLCSIFKNATGKSFKKYQIDLKIAKAREYFATIPNITVSEVAYKLGYDDPFYFCRLYKKYTGVPPSKDKIRK